MIQHDHGDEHQPHQPCDEASGFYELRRPPGLPGPETAHRVAALPAPAPLPFERLRVEARDEALDCVMYAGAEYAALLGVEPMPIIDWLTLDGEVAESILPALRERDRIGRERYGVPLMIEAGHATDDYDELEGALVRYESAVVLARLFCAATKGASK